MKDQRQNEKDIRLILRPKPFLFLPQKCESLLAFPIPSGSHSEASLATPAPSATGGPGVLPTSMVARKTKTALLHRSPLCEQPQDLGVVPPPGRAREQMYEGEY